MFSGSSIHMLSELFTDSLRPVRLQNSIRLFQGASEFLYQCRIEPRTIPLKTLSSILEMSSLEEDESMISKWIGLLATAAAGETVHPSFPKILSELTLNEIYILDFMYEKYNVRRDVTAPDIPPKYEYRSHGNDSSGQETHEHFYSLNDNLSNLRQSGMTELELHSSIVNLKKLSMMEEVVTYPDPNSLRAGKITLKPNLAGYSEEDFREPPSRNYYRGVVIGEGYTKELFQHLDFISKKEYQANISYNAAPNIPGAKMYLSGFGFNFIQSCRGPVATYHT